MSNFFLAGVAKATLFDGDELIGVAKTLVENIFELQVSQEFIRGGGNGDLLGVYTHSPTLSVSIENALFNLDYIRLQTGGQVKIGSDYLGCEVVKCIEDGVIQVSNTPLKFYNSQLICGWLEDNTVIEFEGKIAKNNVFKSGEFYSIKYYWNVPEIRELTIPSTILPKEIRLVLDINVYFTDTDFKSLKRYGKIQINIPRFQLNGNVSIPMSMTGYSTSRLDGVALLARGNGCNDGYYAKISEDIKYEVYQTLGDIDDLTLGEIDPKTLQKLDVKTI